LLKPLKAIPMVSGSSFFCGGHEMMALILICR
jgi:hypothetical protein